MSNKNFEEKVLKALWNIEQDVSWLKQDVSWLKQDVSWLKEDVAELKDNVVKLDKKIDTVEYKLSNKIDSQTSDLKETMWLHANYLNQTFEHISRIDKERVMRENNVKVSYV